MRRYEKGKSMHHEESRPPMKSFSPDPAIDASVEILEYAKRRLRCSQRRLAQLLGVHESLISRIANGDRSLTMKHMVALAEACEMTPAVLYWNANREAGRILLDRSSKDPELASVADRFFKEQTDEFVSGMPARPHYRERIERITREIGKLRSRIIRDLPKEEDVDVEDCLTRVLAFLPKELGDIGIYAAAIYDLQAHDTLGLQQEYSDSKRNSLRSQFRKTIPRFAGNLAWRAITIDRTTSIGFSRTLPVFGDAWCHECPATIDDKRFELAIPVPSIELDRESRKLPPCTQVLIVAGVLVDEADEINWIHQECLERCAGLIQIVRSLRFARIAKLLMREVAGSELLSRSPANVSTQLHEHTEAAIVQFLGDVIEELEPQVAIADYWAFDPQRYLFFSINDLSFKIADWARGQPAGGDSHESTVEEAFREHREKHFRPRSLGISFTILKTGRPWVVYEPYAKRKACMNLGSFLGVPLYLKDEEAGLIGGVLYLRYLDDERSLGRKQFAQLARIVNRYHNTLSLTIIENELPAEERMVRVQY